MTPTERVEAVKADMNPFERLTARPAIILALELASELEDLQRRVEEMIENLDDIDSEIKFND